MSKEDIFWICWKAPEIIPEDNIIILSFLSPAQEERLKKKHNSKFISARQLASNVKDEALKVYVNLIAKIGSTPGRDGKTLRSSLKRKDGVSLWWFHKVSEKDCESDPAFNFIIEILIVTSLLGLNHEKEVVLFGACKEVADVLQKLYKIKRIQCGREYSLSYIFFRALLSRIKYFFVFLARWLVVKRKIRVSQTTFDVICSGFWDWSVKEDSQTGKLFDRYFQLLPEELASKGLKVGWFLWFDPYSERVSKNRKITDIIEPIQRHHNLVILNHFIGTADLLKVILNFNPFFVFFRFRRSHEFKKAFMVNGIDFTSVLHAQLFYNFLNSLIPHLELVYTATARAFAQYQPKVSLSFLELFLYSKANYAGGREGFRKTIHCAVQHASYCREKTFLLLDPRIEYDGAQDNCPLPKPDYVFAMGELGREIFMESGFPAEKVFLTGSPRYRSIKTDSIRRGGKLKDVKNILLVTSLDMNLEMEMIEAVYFATMDLPQVNLFLRNHPFAKIQELPSFRSYKHRIRNTGGTLDEDLENADLVIFSYSTVAEQALLQGIPVWQWLSASYNGSVFRDLRVIPSFYSVSDLRESLKRFIAHPDSFIPDEETKEFVLRKCFYKADGMVNQRIVDIITSKLL